MQLSLAASHLERFANRYPSLKAASRWGIAISGGADSTALALAAGELGRDLTLLHVNYGLRGVESDGDEAFVRGLGFGAEVLRPRVENASEEHLRRLRYEWFAGFDFPVLTGHTRDDQAETVLHRLLRGTGPGGLAGIQPNLDGRVYRPFLELTRAELRSYLAERGQSWREDSSNLDLQYRRNYLRHELLPRIVENVNPAAGAALARLAAVARDEEEWLGAMCTDLLPHFVHREGVGWILHAKELAEAPVALQRRLLRALFARLGHEDEAGFDHIESALALCRDESGTGRLQIPGLDLLRSFDEVRVMRQSELPGGDRNFRVALNAPGTTELPGANCAVQATLGGISPYNEGVPDLDWDLVQNALRFGARLELRNWRPGDAYQRSGRDRPDTLKELFQKFRIPLWQRRSWPIVVLKDEPVWAREFGVAAAYAARPESKIALRLEFLPHLEAPG